MNSYHNTTNLAGQQLAEAESQARTQEEMILDYYKNCYRANGGQKRSAMRSPSQVWRFFGQKWPLTSVRRAITNLSHPEAGHLVQLDGEKRTGEYGRPEGCWIYKPRPAQARQGDLFSAPAGEKAGQE